MVRIEIGELSAVLMYRLCKCVYLLCLCIGCVKCTLTAPLLRGVRPKEMRQVLSDPLVKF